MPNKKVDELTRKIEKIENALVELKTDAVWIKRILIGAASLGAVGKFVASIMGAH